MKRMIVVAIVALGLAAAFLAAAPQKGKMIQIKGSDTLVNLVQILAERYMELNPGVSIAVIGGGSSTGISAIINQTTDIANHSREWRPKEIDQAWEKGVKPLVFPIAVDGVSIIVNEKNTLDQLSMGQVGALYRGEVRNWKALGGPDKAVSLYGRQSNSGTYVFMQEVVLGNKNYSTDMKEMNGNAQIIEGILQDEGGIGYVGVGYLYDQSGRIRKGIKLLKISKTEGGAGFLPTDKAAVDNGDYPVARDLYQATPGKPGGEIAKFIAWEAGPEGQKIVEREGFFTIGARQKAQIEKNLK